MFECGADPCRSYLSPSAACLERLFCESSERTSRHGGFSTVLAEITSLALARSLPFLSGPRRRRLLQAGRYGRLGLACQGPMFATCEEENWSFMHNAESFTRSTVGNYNQVERLISWSLNKLATPA